MRRISLRRIRLFRYVASISGVLVFVLAFLTFIPITNDDNETAAIINPTTYALSLTTGPSPYLELTPSTDGAINMVKDTVTVNAKSPSGYELYISTSTNDTNMHHTADPVDIPTENKTIFNTSSPFATPSALSLSSNQSATWGFAIPGLSQFDNASTYDNKSASAKFAGMPSAGNEVKVHTLATAGTDTTDIYYGALANYGASNGEYTTTINYYTVTQVTDKPAGEMTISPNTLDEGYTATTATITTSLDTTRNLGDVTATIGTTSCTNVAILKQNPLTFTCTIPAGISAGKYDVNVHTGIGLNYGITNGVEVNDQFTLNYNANGGSGVPASTTTKSPGTTTSIAINTTTIPTRTGYTFLGYAASSTATTPDYTYTSSSNTFSPASVSFTAPGSKTLYAVWKANTYTITYYLGNGTTTAGATKLGTSTCTYDASCTLTTFANLGGTAPSGWYIYGWNTSTTGYGRSSINGTSLSNGATVTYNIAGNTTLYATFYKNFYFNTGIAPVQSPSTSPMFQRQYWNPYSTTTGLSSITIPTQTNINGWTFVGYVAASNTASSTVTFAASTVGTTVTPTYNTGGTIRSVYKRTATVKYNANGGSGTTSSTTTTQYYNSGWGASDGSANTGANVSTPKVTLATNAFTRTYYAFSKWAAGSTSGTQYAAGASYTFSNGVSASATVNMYAIWKITTIANAYGAAGKTKTSGYYTMQDMTTTICNSVSGTDETGVQVRDSRDNKLYWIAKLKDDNCWMTQNLDYDLSTSKTLTTANSNVSADWTPERNTISTTSGTASGWTDDNNNPYSVDRGSYYLASGSSTTLTAITCTTTTNGGKNCHYHIGNHYNWSAAVASNNTSSITEPYTTRNYSICPKGWKLPLGTSFTTLNTAYGGSTSSDSILRSSPLYFVRSGFLTTSSLSGIGSYGYYWSSMVYSDISKSYHLFFHSDGVSPGTAGGRGGGNSIRCLVR